MNKLNPTLTKIIAGIICSLIVVAAFFLASYIYHRGYQAGLDEGIKQRTSECVQESDIYKDYK